MCSPPSPTLRPWTRVNSRRNFIISFSALPHNCQKKRPARVSCHRIALNELAAQARNVPTSEERGSPVTPMYQNDPRFDLKAFSSTFLPWRVSSWLLLGSHCKCSQYCPRAVLPKRSIMHWMSGVHSTPKGKQTFTAWTMLLGTNVGKPEAGDVAK